MSVKIEAFERIGSNFTKINTERVIDPLVSIPSIHQYYKVCKTFGEVEAKEVIELFSNIPNSEKQLITETFKKTAIQSSLPFYKKVEPTTNKILVLPPGESNDRLPPIKQHVGYASWKVLNALGLGFDRLKHIEDALGEVYLSSQTRTGPRIYDFQLLLKRKRINSCGLNNYLAQNLYLIAPLNDLDYAQNMAAVHASKEVKLYANNLGLGDEGLGLFYHSDPKNIIALVREKDKSKLGRIVYVQLALAHLAWEVASLGKKLASGDTRKLKEFVRDYRVSTYNDMLSESFRRFGQIPTWETVVLDALQMRAFLSKGGKCS